MNFDIFINNLESMIHEAAVKIGYSGHEAVGIYYTKDLMHELIGISDYQNIDIKEVLKTLKQALSIQYGSVKISGAGERYKVTVPEQGVRYILEKFKDNHFLEDLICQLNKKENSIDDILSVFKRYSDEVICEKVADEEFEYAVSFRDKQIDSFIYCFTFDEMGQYYHRFTPYDYKRLVG